MLLPLLGYCTSEGTLIDERQKWWNCEYQRKPVATRRGKYSVSVLQSWNWDKVAL